MIRPSYDTSQRGLNPSPRVPKELGRLKGRGWYTDALLDRELAPVAPLDEAQTRA
jgi:hypothetical protein